ncbi:hypothetical protein F5Y00DRAFT_256648 [Daldinia vernicosa]|uniref:uncharacterized protein n=1 Tax=Daldinia vernicosa TaxID=114800 RepID=UPI002008AD25|nr:uncharacterized protein F5Y00DRAFT_256648 [Daldinia vernicosa]KAI0854150.1 hypothetical protein F5Y00DRAFT_256648 [Daldinia vernicosa]
MDLGTSYGRVGREHHDTKTGSGDSGTDHEYRCLFPPDDCPRDSCPIHGEPSEAQKSIRMARQVSRYDPTNPRELCEPGSFHLRLRRKKLISLLQKGSAEETQEATYAADFTSPQTHRMDGTNTETVLPATIGGSDDSEPWYTPEFLSNSSGCPQDTEEIELPCRDLWKPAKQYVLGSSNGSRKTSIPDNNDYVDRVFANEAKRLEAIRSHSTNNSQSQGSMPLMFQYGIRYAPDPYPAPAPVSRTIMITGFPPATPLSDIMARIRGGQVLSVTAAMSPDPVGPTVIVEFKETFAAWAYVHYVEREMPFAFSGGFKVTLVSSHSYPKKPELQRDLSNGFTRLVVFLNFAVDRSFEFLDDLEDMLGNPEDILEDSWIQKGALFILFKSVATASKYYKTVVCNQETLEPGSFDSDLHRFAPDPCNRPLCDLRRPFRPARYPYESLLDQWAERNFQAATSTVHSDSAYQPHAPTHDYEEYEDEGVLSQAEEKQEMTQPVVNLLDSPIHEISREKFPVITESPTEAPQEQYPLIDLSIDEDKDEKMIPKHTLPQTDLAYHELLHRDSSDLVSLSEANAIYHTQPFRTIPKAEWRARYSGIFQS